VIILKENRSFDGYFGKLPGADGATTATMSNGDVVPLGQTPDPLPNDINHSYVAFQTAFDNGRMDGFDQQKGAYSASGQPLALTQMSEAQIPNYWAYAKTYAVGDHFFAPWKGSSFGNNLYSVAAQAGRYDKSIGKRTVFDHPQTDKEPKPPAWGCDDPPETLVTMVNPLDEKSEMYPCFNFKALPDILKPNGVTWGAYEARVDSRGTNWHNSLDAIRSVRSDPSQWANVKSFDTFFTDAAAGNLPNVSWVLGNQLEHPPSTACSGENETVNIVNAIMKSSAWSSTAIFIYWDEWGGFYDHVAPPQPNNVSFGFRVPLIVISPYTKYGTGANGGFVDHTFYSHSSTLKFVEANWSLPSLTPADQNAHDMMNLFDFSETPKPSLLLTKRTCPKLNAAERQLLATRSPD